MESLLDQAGPVLSVFALAASLIALVLALMARAKARALDARWRRILDGSNAQSLEGALNDHLQTVLSMTGRIDEAADRITSLEAKMDVAKRFLGVVRYDAFEDMGGAQSFAMAIYDDKGDGAVVTSQVGRTDCRVYAKELRGGRSDRELSTEEKQAVEVAARNRPFAGTPN